MKKLIKFIGIGALIYSCGGPDNGTVESDGVLPGEHRIFITKSSSIKADFSSSGLTGIAGADALCNAYAEAASLKKEYKAIISDDTSAAKDRLVFTGSIYTVSGSIKTKVAESSSEFWDSSSSDLLSKIDWDEDGRSVTSGNVWTGTTSSGTSHTENCSNWATSSLSDGSKKGGFGDVNQTNDLWIEDGTGQPCSLTAHLYCISQD